ncbi:hypothetical protein GGF32_001036 [Allomyces javanicus]|nr:hypothetical protein GGF32_001036 [Allomyces javanicus]
MPRPSGAVAVVAVAVIATVFHATYLAWFQYFINRAMFKLGFTIAIARLIIYWAVVATIMQQHFAAVFPRYMALFPPGVGTSRYYVAHAAAPSSLLSLSALPAGSAIARDEPVDAAAARSTRPAHPWSLGAKWLFGVFAVLFIQGVVMLLTLSMSTRGYVVFRGLAFAEELAILWLSLRTHRDFATLALMALATVGLIVFIDSGFLSDVIFAWRARVPLRDLYGDALKQLLARQLPPHSPGHGPRFSSQTHIFRSGGSSGSAASPASVAAISAPTSTTLTPTVTKTFGPSGPWTPRLIIQAHRRLRKHAGIAPQYHLARFIAIMCTIVFRVVSLQAGAPDDWIAWGLEFVPIAAMAIAYLASAVIVVALLHRKIGNLGFDRTRLIGDSAPHKAGGGCGVTPSTLSTCEEKDLSNVSASPLASVRDRRTSAIPAVRVQLLPIRVELTDLWCCTSPSLVLWLAMYAIIILLAL